MHDAAVEMLAKLEKYQDLLNIPEIWASQLLHPSLKDAGLSKKEREEAINFIQELMFRLDLTSVADNSPTTSGRIRLLQQFRVRKQATANRAGDF